MGVAESDPIALGSGRSGRVRAALRKSLAIARDRDGWSATDEVRALLAERLADVVDRAAKAGDGPGMERAAAKLLDAMSLLPLEVAKTSEGGAAGGADDRRAGVLELLDRPPAVGDSSHS